MTAHDFADAPCIGQWFLFEATDTPSHVEARWHCTNTCPLATFTACQELVKAEQRNPNGHPTGTWAGRLYGDKGPVASCGTESGYRRHTRSGEEPCRSCKDGKNAAVSERWHRKKGAA